MSSLTIQWAAGFFEGEGYIGFKKSLNKTYDRFYSRLSISIAQVHREPLDAFREIVGVGKVYGPYGPYKSTKQPYFAYNASGADAVLVAEKLLPFLFQKGNQVEVALKEYKEYNA